MAAQLTVQNLWVRYPTSVRVIEAVRGGSFGLGREKLGLVGASGSGKFIATPAVLGLETAPRRLPPLLATALSLLAALAAAACTHADTCTSEATIAEYRLQPGDQVHVTVHRHEDLHGEFEVNRDGSLAAPSSIDVRAKGLTARQLEDQIETRLRSSAYVSPQVSVHIVRYRPIHLLDLPVEYKPGMTVGDLFARCNLPTYRSDPSEWLIERGECSFEAEPDRELLPGDTVTIRERFF